MELMALSCKNTRLKPYCTFMMARKHRMVTCTSSMTSSKVIFEMEFFMIVLRRRMAVDDEAPFMVADDDGEDEF